jgi:xylulokinase
VPDIREIITAMPLVAGVDTSTQSCKVVIRDADTGALVREGRAPHPEGTEVQPADWWRALQEAAGQAGGLDDVAAVAVGGQQHGMVCLDADGEVVRPALLWTDTRSARAAADLVDELGGPDAGGRAWAEAVGVVPVASFTVSKLRWLADHEPANAARTAAVCLPHDWLTWRLAGGGPRGAAGLDALVTDRGDASGTGYWSAASGEYRLDLLERAVGSRPLVPRVLAPSAVGGATPAGALLGPGTGDNAAAALGVDAQPGDVLVSIGTSGVACAVSDVPAADPTGTVAGFADATGRYLPLIATLNAARVLDAAARLLGVDHEQLSRLALSAPAGADGLVLVPYLEGERTPNRPDATGAVHGLRLGTSTPAHLARAAVEGLLCGLADGLDAIVAQGAAVRRVLLVGGGARSEAVRRIAPAVLGRPVLVPAPGEYVADGAARQAAWALSGATEPPHWQVGDVATYEAEPTPDVRARYAEVRELTAHRPDRPAGCPR